MALAMREEVRQLHWPSGDAMTVRSGWLRALEVPTATAVFATRTMAPFYEGREWFGASVRWPGGDEGDFSVSFDVVGSPESASIELG